MSIPSPVVGIDLGGTKILAAVVDVQGDILGRSKKRSVPKGAANPGPALIADRMAEAVREAVAKAGISLDQIEAIGACAPGPVNVTTGEVLRAVNLPHWSEPFALGPALSERLDGLPVAIDNDANLGTLGEAAFGAGKGIDDLIGIFVGTGVGGGLILGGELRRGVRWAAGELGHMTMRCKGMQADIEAFASRGAISRRLRKIVKKGKSPIIVQILRDRRDERITSGVIRKALAAGDARTRQVIGDSQRVLALHIASLVNLLDPECIVLGGGLVESLGDDYVDTVRTLAYDNFFLQHDRERVKIVPAALGDDAVVMGAAVLARRRGAAWG